MKRKFKMVTAFALTAAMVMGAAVTASAMGASQAELPTTYTSTTNIVMETPYAEPVNNVAINGFRHKISTIIDVYDEVYGDVKMPGEFHIAAKVVPAEEMYASWDLMEQQFAQQVGYVSDYSMRAEFAKHTPAGYTWYFIDGSSSSIDVQQNYGYAYWWYYVDVANASNWTDLNYTNSDFFCINSYCTEKKFTVTVNGVAYPECVVMIDTDADDMTSDFKFALLLPQNFNGRAAIKIFGGKEENGEVVSDESSCLIYSILEGTPEQNTALPTQTAPVWKQDAIGWWIENPDGSYLQNAWYQSPVSGLWYYMGADGYMLTNTTTPDGYAVGADGVMIP